MGENIYPKCFEIFGFKDEIDGYDICNGTKITRRKLNQLKLCEVEPIEIFIDRCKSSTATIADYILVTSHLDPRVTDVFDVIYELEIDVEFQDPEEPLYLVDFEGDEKIHVSTDLLHYSIYDSPILENPENYALSVNIINYIKSFDGKFEKDILYRIGSLMYFHNGSKYWDEREPFEYMLELHKLSEDWEIIYEKIDIDQTFYDQFNLSKWMVIVKQSLF